MSSNINNKISWLIKICQLFLLLSSILVQTSCKKFVEIKPPTTSLVATNVFDKNSTATAAQLAIYAQMQSYPFNIDWTTGLSSDELKNFSSSQTAIDLYANALDAAVDANGIGIWKPTYNFIYEGNAILEGLSNSPGVTDAVKKQLNGESKFLRAFWYFYLVKLYGDVPLVLTTDYKVNSNLSRAPKAQVYEQIIADLTDAQNLLNSNYVDATDTVTTVDRVRPTSWAASALLASVYLYTGDWTKAETQASSVINNTSLFTLPSKLDSVFLKNSREAIWQLIPNSSNKYTPEGNIFILNYNPATNYTSFTTTISDTLMNTFENGDARKIKWVGKYTDAVRRVDYYYPHKYKANSTSTSLTEYSMVLRLAEQYLIRAEAKAQQNNLAGAIIDINTIRNRAGLPNLSASLTKQQVLAAIMHERQVELFAEGHRWTDLKRIDKVDVVMGGITPKKGGTWSSYKQLYPIPITDIQNGINIIQNDGYN